MRKRVLLSLIPVGLAILVFWPVAKFDFLDWDDWIMVVENPDFHPPTWSNLGHYWTELRSGHIQHYVPLTYTTYAGLTWLSLHAPSAIPAAQIFHLTNLLCHLIACILVFWLLRDLFKDDWPAVAGALVFAIHPVQTEPIAWIASLNTVLAGMFGILALWLYVRHVRDKRPRARTFYFIGATLAAVLAMFAKPSAMILPLLAGLIDWYLLQRPLERIWKPLTIWLVLGLVFAVIQKIDQPAIAMAGAPIPTRPLIALDTIGFYIAKIILPWSLSAEYGRTPQWVMHNWQIGLTCFVTFAAFASAWLLRKKIPEFLAGLVLLLFSIAPVLGLVTFEFQRYSTVADRYLYMGMLGVALVAASAVSRWRQPAWVIVIFVVVLMATRSAFQVWTWRNTPDLLTSTLRFNPQSQMAHKIRGFELARGGLYGDAINEYKASLDVRPDDPATQLDLANAYSKSGQYDPAIKIYDELCHSAPSDEIAAVHQNYAVTLIRVFRIDEAGPHFEAATKAAPQSPEIWLGYGKWLEIKGRMPEAIAAYKEALQLRPDLAIAQQALTRAQQPATTQTTP